MSESDARPPCTATPYYTAVAAADDALEADLIRLRARQDAGEVTVREAADERVRLLEGHIQRVRDLRREHLGR